MKSLPEFYDLPTEKASSESFERQLDDIEREMLPPVSRPARRKARRVRIKKAA